MDIALKSTLKISLQLKLLLTVLVFAILLSCKNPETLQEDTPSIISLLNESQERQFKENLTQAEIPQPPVKESVIKDVEKNIVSQVIDGDTIILNTDERVRLICIDTPERGEYYADKAAAYLRGLVLNKEVNLVKDVSEVDRYGRLLRYVYVDGVFVNQKLVEEGYAKVYRYPPDTSLCDTLEQAEAKARLYEVGIWAAAKPTTAPEPVKSPAPSSSNYVCTSNFYNCDDFNTHAEAQRVFEACGATTDIHQLDRDKDGLACETLP